MGHATKPTRQNRTITVDFHDETPYFHLLGDRKAFVECVLAFLLALGFQLTHKASCSAGGHLTRHSHYVRIRLGGLTIWRVQCTTCKAVFTVLPHLVLRYRQMRQLVARDALLAPHGGLSLDLCAVIGPISPMAVYRLVCSCGHQSVVPVLTRCGLPLPTSILADEKHSRCLTDKVYLPTIVSAACSGTWGTAMPRVSQPSRSPMVHINALPSSRSPRTRCEGPSPMAATARPRVCGRCFPQRAWACACATPSTSFPTR